MTEYRLRFLQYDELVPSPFFRADGVCTFCLLASNVRRAINTVICRRKSKRTAIAAYRENTRTAGMLVRAPRQQRLELVIIVNMVNVYMDTVT